MHLRLKELRIKHEISQKAVCLALGIPQNTFSQYENNKREPDLNTIAKIAQYFDVPVDDLFCKEPLFEVKSTSVNHNLTFGMQLKLFRQQAGMSQMKLSAVLNVSQQTIAKWESGKATPNPEMLSRIADYFDVSVDCLFGRESSPQKSTSTVAEHLRTLRSERGLYQKEVASFLGVDRTTYVKYELGTSAPSNDILAALADYFDVSVDYLLGRTNLRSAPDGSSHGVKIPVLGKGDSMFASILRNLRKANHVTQRHLADSLYIDCSTVTKWETGKAIPSPETLNKVADYFGVSVDYLLGRTNSRSAPDDSSKGVKVPVLGNVQAGIPIEAVEDIIDYEEISQEMASRGDYFALKVRGTSMEPKFSEGDVVIVKKQNTADTGDIVIALVNGNDATIKKLKYTKEGLYLLPSNPEFEPMFFSKHEVVTLPVTICGVVVELRAKF